MSGCQCEGMMSEQAVVSVRGVRSSASTRQHASQLPVHLPTPNTPPNCQYTSQHLTRLPAASPSPFCRTSAARPMSTTDMRSLLSLKGGSSVKRTPRPLPPMCTVVMLRGKEPEHEEEGPASTSAASRAARHGGNANENTATR